jgi:hypothetical protein
MNRPSINHMRIPRSYVFPADESAEKSLPNPAERLATLIRQRPGISLVVSLTAGVVLGCLIKRR